jgi:hypothetical protein
MKKLQNFKAINLTEDQMRKVSGGGTTSYTGNGSGGDVGSGGRTTFTSGPAQGQETKDPNTGH